MLKRGTIVVGILALVGLAAGASVLLAPPRMTTKVTIVRDEPQLRAENNPTVPPLSHDKVIFDDVRSSGAR